jgi:YVTN family beta-propeller protein
VIDSTTNTVTDTITVGVGPRGVTVLADEVYVANFESDTVSVINALTNTVTHTIAVGNTPRGITASNGNIYVENYQAGTISIINPTTHLVTSTHDVGNTPAGFTTVGTDLYISRFTDNVVSIFDTNTNTLRSTCAADSTPPTLSSHTPTGNAVMNLDTVTELTMTFDENITKGTGNITIYNVSDDSLVATIDVATIAVSTSGAVATITLPAALSALGGYYVHVPNTAFLDGSSNTFAGIADNTTFTFQGVVPDVTSPTFTIQFYSDAGLTPTIADNATLGAGVYYVKITANEALNATPTLSIDSEGTANDITNGTTTLVS